MATTPSDLRPASAARPRPVLIAGPTAVGKSEIAALLAERLGGEIISVDSMQVYRGLDIGTAKPSPAERARVPHHLIDVADLNESFDAAKFVLRASRAVDEIQSRNRAPILCGGTGLYFKAFLEGLGEAPRADPGLRAELEATPLSELLVELAGRDPVTFENIDRQNPRRIIRALEVIRLTGRPFSEQKARWSGPHPGSAAAHSGPRASSPVPRTLLQIGLTRSSSDLRARIDARVDEMFRRGLVAETARLLDRGLLENKTALQALGYRQVVEHLRGERSLDQTLELVRIRTRQFARRQMTWFRRQMNLDWIRLEPETDPKSVVETILNLETAR